MTWADLTPELVGADVPPLADVPDLEPRTPHEGLEDRRLALSIDEIDIYLRKVQSSENGTSTTKPLGAEGNRTSVGGPNAPADYALRQLLAKLDERAAQARMTRRLRKLTVPAEVWVEWWGATKNGRKAIVLGKSNDYEGILDKLEENTSFHVRGGDYTTPVRKITVVGPPVLEELRREEYQPAYRYHRIPRDGTLADLRGKQQRLAETPMSPTGDKSFTVPTGTKVVLRGSTDKRLQPDGVQLAPDGAPLVKAELKLIEDNKKQTFQLTFDDVRVEQDFKLVFTDTDGVKSERPFKIRPYEDAAPEADDVHIEGIRKNNQGNYLCTVIASIPFAGKASDDVGLDNVEFVYTIARADTPGKPAGNPVQMMAACLLLTGGSPADAMAALALAMRQREQKPAPDNRDVKAPERVRVPAFAGALRNHASPLLSKAELSKRLAEPFRGKGKPLPNIFDFKADDPECAFDLRPLGLEAADKELQPRYRMQLWIEATDNNIESGPHRSSVKERPTFLLVSEMDLLAEIGTDEEKLHIKLDEAVKNLREAESRLATINQDLATGAQAERIRTMGLEVETFEQVLEKSLSTANDVRDDYLRLIKEMKTNRVRDNLIVRLDSGIAKPLGNIIQQDFELTRASLVDLRVTLTKQEADLKKTIEQSRSAGTAARQQLRELIDRLDKVLGAMEKIGDLNQLIKRIKEIQDKNRTEYDLLKLLRKQLEDEFYKLLDQQGDAPKEKKP